MRRRFSSLDKKGRPDIVLGISRKGKIRISIAIYCFQKKQVASGPSESPSEPWSSPETPIPTRVNHAGVHVNQATGYSRLPVARPIQIIFFPLYTRGKRRVCRQASLSLSFISPQCQSFFFAGETVSEREIMGEKGVSLEELKRRMAEFASERDWDQFHSPRNLLLALVKRRKKEPFLL